MALTLTCLVASSPVGLAAPPDDNLAAARAAYIATEDQEALKILSAPGHGSLADQFDVYRALCLLALGRMNEVDRVLRSIATRNPSFRMSEAEVTPRMIALYDAVRRETVETMARDAYAEAKTHFDAGRFADASARFGSVIALLGPGATRPTGRVRRPTTCCSSRTASRTSPTASSPAPGETLRTLSPSRPCLQRRRPLP